MTCFLRKKPKALPLPFSPMAELWALRENRLQELNDLLKLGDIGPYLAVTGNHQMYLTNELTCKPFNWWGGVPEDAALLDLHSIYQAMLGSFPVVWYLEAPLDEDIRQTRAIHKGQLVALKPQ